jgi:hypothetical protein
MEAKSLSPLKAIKAHCLDCSGGSRKEVQGCEIADCPLYPYRLGKNPRRREFGQKTPEKAGVFEGRVAAR